METKKQKQNIWKQNKLRHAKDNVKSCDFDIFFFLKPNVPSHVRTFVFPLGKEPLTLC